MSLVTKNALANSLKELLKTKTLDKITIKEIVNDCGLNRQSFYYHYKNIYDLVSWTFAMDVESSLKGKVNYSDWQEGFLVILNYCKNHKLIIHNLYHSQGKNIIEDGLKNYVINLLLKVIEEEIHNLNINVSKEDKIFIANYNMFAFVGLIMLWIENDMEEDPILIIKRIHTLIEGDFKKALMSFSSK